MIRCDGCGTEYILGLSEKKPNDTCPHCHRPTKEVCMLSIDRRRIALDLGSEITEAHIDKYSPEYNKVVGRVVANPARPSLWGIRFDGVGDIVIRDASGAERIVTDGGVVPVVRELELKFQNNRTAIIK